MKTVDLRLFKKIVRSIQVYFPFLKGLIYNTKFYYYKLFSVPHEKEFKGVKIFSNESDKVFLDIGANKGQSIDSILLFAPSDTKIIAFEANPVLATRLSRIFSKSKNICIEHFGLSDTESTNVLFIPFYKKWMFDGLSSFNSIAHVNYFKHHLFNFQEKNVSVKRETCHCKRLDDLSLDPYFIKIDVENFESNVLLGGLETIKKSLPIILIESLDEACVKIMQSLGYRFYEYEDSKEIFVECPPRYNTFCLHPFEHMHLIK